MSFAAQAFVRRRVRNRRGQLQLENVAGIDGRFSSPLEELRAFFVTTGWISCESLASWT